MDTKTHKPKVEHEKVLDVHPVTGRPHVTEDSKGQLHHYPDGCPKDGRLVEVTVSVRVRGGVVISASVIGPPKVASEAFRSGWDAIDWSRKAN